MIAHILFVAFIAIIFIQFFYYVLIFRRFAFSKSEKNTLKNVPISVIVCAKNEEENVKKYLPLLLNQNYPLFEVVLIDDSSFDHTLDIFEDFAKNHSNIKLVKIQNNEAFWGNKKYALTLGIKAAKNEYLVFIDADCYPNSTEWLANIASKFSKDKTIVLGYGGYEKVKGSFLNYIIRYETLLSAIQYFSWAKLGKPYMGVGRNMAYKREEFFKVNGFINHIKIRSGDDDLFINEAATSKNTTTIYTPESFTYSKPKYTFKEWFTQKRRHINTANYYKFFDKLQLSIFYTSQLLFLILALILIIIQYQIYWVLFLLGLRYLFSWIIIIFSSYKLKEKDIAFGYPVAEMVLILMQLFIYISTKIRKPVHWR